MCKGILYAFIRLMSKLVRSYERAERLRVHAMLELSPQAQLNMSFTGEVL